VKDVGSSIDPLINERMDEREPSATTTTSKANAEVTAAAATATGRKPGQAPEGRTWRSDGRRVKRYPVALSSVDPNVIGSPKGEHTKKKEGERQKTDVVETRNQ
jgi:hypothetical protein